MKGMVSHPKLTNGVAPASSALAPEDARPGQSAPVARKVQRVQSENALRTPTAARVMNDKENDTPSTGSRSAKDRALTRLHDLAPDVALYEKETRRVGGVVYGGRKVSDPDRVMLRTKDGQHRKRSHDTDGESADGSEEGADGDATEAARKKRKTKKSVHAKQAVLHRLLLSADERWLNKPKKESEDMVSPFHVILSIYPSKVQAHIVQALRSSFLPNIILQKSC